MPVDPTSEVKNVTTSDLVSVLFVEDSDFIQILYRNLVDKETLKCNGYFARSLQEARKLLKENTFDAIVTDLNLEDGSALDLMPLFDKTPTIFVTSHDEVATATTAVKAGAYEYIVKDEDLLYLQQLPALVDRAINQSQTQKALQESENRYRELFENASDLIFSFGPDGKLMYVNPVFMDVLGFSKNEWKGLAFETLVHPTDHKHLHQVLEKVKQGTRFHSVELKLLSRTKEKIIVEGNLIGKFEGGRLDAIRALLRNVTERKHAEDQLRRSEENYRFLVEDVDDVIYKLDAKGRVTFINDYGVSLTGFSKEEIKGLHFTDIIREDYKESVAAFYFNQVAHKIPLTTLEFPIITKSGEEKWVGQKVKLRHDSNKKGLAGFLAVVRDMSDKQKADQQIREQALKLEEQNQEIKETLANLVKARVGRRATTIVLAIAVLLFILSEGLLEPLVEAQTESPYIGFIFKGCIALLLKPIDILVERYLTKSVMRGKKYKFLESQDDANSTFWSKLAPFK